MSEKHEQEWGEEGITSLGGRGQNKHVEGVFALKISVWKLKEISFNCNTILGEKTLATPSENIQTF